MVINAANAVKHRNAELAVSSMTRTGSVLGGRELDGIYRAECLEADGTAGR